MKPGERLAVIDLGSNSFRLVVFMAGEGWWKRTDEIYEPVRIGEGLVASGELGDEPMERALATLDVFAQFCHASGLRRGARSTRSRRARSATRRTRGLPGSALRALRLPIRVLSPRGRRRATATWRRSTRRRSTDGCVLDLGGGSLQLVRVLERHRARLGLLARWAPCA